MGIPDDGCILEIIYDKKYKKIHVQTDRSSGPFTFASTNNFAPAAFITKKQGFGTVLGQ